MRQTGEINAVETEGRERVFTLPASTAVFVLLPADPYRVYFSITTASTSNLTVGFQSDIASGFPTQRGRVLSATTFTEWKVRDIGELITREFYCINTNAIAEDIIIGEVRYVSPRRENRRSDRKRVPELYVNWRERFRRFIVK